MPVAVFLSSGFDSGAITALAAETHSNLYTVTLGFNEFRGTSDDETVLAEKTAANYRTCHFSEFIDRSVFHEHRERLLQFMDQPSIDGVNTYFVSLVAKQRGYKVALSGLGGDEIFGGYPSFKQVPAMAKIFGPLGGDANVLGRHIRSVLSTPLSKITSPKMAGLFEYGGTLGGAYFLRRGLFMPWEIERMLSPDTAKSGWEQLASIPRMNEMLAPLATVGNSQRRNYLSVSALETTFYMRNQLLRDADWAGMAHSVEIRVPLVDPWLYRALAPLRNGKFRPNKEDMIARLQPPLPDEVRTRSKTGFNIPVREWLQENHERGLRGWAKHVLKHFQPGLLPA